MAWFISGDVMEGLKAADLQVDLIQEGQVVFRYDNPGQVLEHLLKSGAGTAYYDAVDPGMREALGQEFLRRLVLRNPQGPPYPVIHDYVACIAKKA